MKVKKIDIRNTIRGARDFSKAIGCNVLEIGACISEDLELRYYVNYTGVMSESMYNGRYKSKIDLKHIYDEYAEKNINLEECVNMFKNEIVNFLDEENY